MTVPRITPSVLRQQFQEQKDIALVDVREEDTFSEGHLLRAGSLPLSRLELLARKRLPRLSMPIVICADDEALAQRAAGRLQEAGYTAVFVLAGGIAAWKAQGLPVYKGVHVPSKGFAEVIEHNNETPYLSAEQLVQLRKSGADIVVLDSRSNEEYRDNTIPTAISVPGAELVYRIYDLAPSDQTTVVVNCGGRTRSIIGAQSLINAGIKNKVYSLKDGTMGWHLAGLTLERGQTPAYSQTSQRGLELAREATTAVAERFKLRAISHAELKAFRAEADQTTLYLFDVRSPEEYRDGHLDGFINIAGGQLIQETDRWIASWQARIVLSDDNCIRAIMTASWLAQLGLANVFYLGEGFGSESLVRDVPVDHGYRAFPLQGPEPKMLTVQEAATEIRAGRAAVIDVSLSSVYDAGHIPGAWHAVRSRLGANLSKLPASDLLIVTSEDGVLARFAASELLRMGRRSVAIGGGTRQWAEAGLGLETGLVNFLDEPDDVYYVPRRRKKDQARYMREYLDWEQGLLLQLGGDADCPFPVHS